MLLFDIIFQINIKFLGVWGYRWMISVFYGYPNDHFKSHTSLAFSENHAEHRPIIVLEFTD